MYDLDNPAAPTGGVETQITGALFKRWMTSWKERIDDRNAGQIVAILHEGKEETLGKGLVTPNWHLTMMGNRACTVSRNFHFKVEIGKPFSHYWHYVLHRIAASQTWHWVGHPNPLIPATNQGGGGAGRDHALLKANLSLVTVQARVRKLDKSMSKSLQNRMVAKLSKWDQAGIIRANARGVFDGGTSA